MSSPESDDHLDLERDLPTTELDIEILRRLRQHRTVSFAETLELLGTIDLFPQRRTERLASESWEPFRL